MMNTQVRHIGSAIVPFCVRHVPATARPIWLAVLAAVLTVVVATGCGAKKTSDRDLVLVEVDQARDLHDRGGGTRLGRARQMAWVDPRTPEEFRKERIPGAILLPLDRARDDHRALREYDLLIVYGNDFNSPRATALSKILIEAGHRDVRTLRGGLRAWKAAGNPTESGE